MSAQFETGKTYRLRFTCDADASATFTVTKRTGKTIWLEGFTAEKRCKIYSGSGADEYCMPYGRYSMAPVLSASREVQP